MKNEKDNRFNELFRRVEVTCKTRYNASTRLQRQHNLSQWTIAIVSVFIIVVSILRMSGNGFIHNSNNIDVLQIISAIVVLVYSLLIGSENFSRRSERLHRCGLELGRIAREIKPYKEKEGTEHDDIYGKLSNSYYDILEKYENHTEVDFLYTKADLSEIYYPKSWQYYPFLVWATIRNMLVFFPHIFIISLIFIVIGLMIYL